MSDHGQDPSTHTSLPESDSEPKERPVGDTEYSWCRGVPGGTGVTVFVLLLSKQPVIRTAVHSLQNAYPIIRSKLRFEPTSRSFSYVIPSSPHLQIEPFDLSATLEIISASIYVSPHHAALEHELNNNLWSSYLDQSLENEIDVFFVSLENEICLL